LSGQAARRGRWRKVNKRKGKAKPKKRGMSLERMLAIAKEANLEPGQSIVINGLRLTKTGKQP